MSTTKQPCKAKDPRTCPWHGAELRMEEAQKTGNFEAYYEARRELDILSAKNIWNEDHVQAVTPYTEEELDEKLAQIIKGIGSINNLANIAEGRGEKEFYIDGISEPFQEVDYTSDSESRQTIYLVLKHDGHLLRFSGWYDSWNGSEWYDSKIDEVEQELSIITELKRHYKSLR